MSQRGKRPNRLDNDEPPPPVKRRKGRPPANKDTKSVAGGGGGGASGGGGSGGAAGGGSGGSGATKSFTEDSKPHAGDSTDGGGAGENASPTKINSGSQQQQTSSAWQARSLSDLKLSSIYNRSAPEPPAELFRKDLISAMKLPDSEPLAADEYWIISDQWKQEWERGVQVPVSPDSLPEPTVLPKKEESFYTGRQDFKLPKNKFIRITRDETFSSELHYLSNTPAMAKAACSYDLDQVDDAWLNILNGERTMAGLSAITEEQFERVVEELEIVCLDKIQAIMKSEDGLGIEYDENVICDVCRSPDSEEANEMVFCDNCNICVHQACYGITTIPSGQWLCRTCSMGQRPDCVLCPNKGGAMKSARSGQKWAHVSCALWIPEVSIGSVDRMEPITKISSIPQSRWALICVLCRERVGACIQCSVKPCKTAYHVTCAFQHGLEMRAIIEDENSEDGVKLRSYCLKHSMNKNNNNNKKEKSTINNNATMTSSTAASTKGAASDVDDVENKRKKRKDMTTEERNLARVKRLQEIESEFHKHVSVKDVSAAALEVDDETINCIYNYWIIKRKAVSNRPLLPPKTDDMDMVAHKQEQADNEKMKMFVHLRQDLERVRNLCYMVSRREKLSRSFFKMREQTFHKQVTVLGELVQQPPDKVDENVLSAVFQANHGSSVYDRLYSSDKFNANDGPSLEEILARLLNDTSIGDGASALALVATKKDHNQKQSYKTDLNGLTKHGGGGGDSASGSNKKSKDNQFKRMYLNGASTATKKSMSGIYGSSLSSDSEAIDRRLRSSSTEDDDDELRKRHNRRRTNTSPVKKKISTTSGGTHNKSLETKSIDRRKRRTSTAAAVAAANRKNKTLDSSSEEDAATTLPNHDASKLAKMPKSRLLRQMERELAKEKMSGSDSDELVPIRNSIGQHIGGDAKKLSVSIYSDSDSTDKDKTDNTASDSQQHPFRTKAALKEFNSHQATTAKTATPRSRKDAANKSKTNRAASVLPSDDERMSSATEQRDRHNKEKVEKEKTQTQKERIEKEKVAKMKEKERLERERHEKERTQREKVEKERLAKIEQERIEKEAAEKERISRLESAKATTKTTKEKKKRKDTSKGFPTDLLVVPQRQAAKKASENMMRTTTTTTTTAAATTTATANVAGVTPASTTPTNKKDVQSKDDEKKESATTKIKDRRESVRESAKSKAKSAKSTQPPTKEDDSDSTPVETKEKEKPKSKSKSDRVDKNIIVAYVPQRQAAKKAAEHIKGLGKPVTADAAAAAAAAVVPPLTDEDTTSATSTGAAISKKGAAISTAWAPDGATTTRHGRDMDSSSSTAASPVKRKSSFSGGDAKGGNRSMSSGSSGSSSTSSSSSSSSNSSSSSESDEGKTPTKVSATSDAKRDRAKDSPFLNKVSKSGSSVASSDDSSNSDSDSSSTSSDADAREMVKTKKSKTSVIAAATVASKRGPRSRKQSIAAAEKKSKDDAKSTTAAAAIASKGDESIRSPTKSASVRGTAKRQSISNDRRQSVDQRSGNLAKNAAKSGASSKAAAAAAAAAAAIVVENRRKSKDAHIKSHESTPKTTRKRKPGHFDDAKRRLSNSRSTHEQSTEQRDRVASAIDAKSEKERVAAAAEKESRKSSELSPKKRETNERLKSPTSTTKNVVGSLEQEMADRKAEQKTTNANSTKASKLSGTLDKLFGRREKETNTQREQEQEQEHELHRDSKEVDLLSDIDMDIEPKDNIDQPIPLSSDAANISDLIDSNCDAKLDTNDDHPNRTELNKSTDDLLAVSEELFSFDSHKSECDDKSIPNSQEQFVNSMPKPPTPKSTSIFSPPPTGMSLDKRDSNSIFDFNENDFVANYDSFSLPTDASNSLLTFPSDHLFKSQTDFKEDSTKETMDLVANLRQNIKKGGKGDDKHKFDLSNQTHVIEIDTSPDSTTMDVGSSKNEAEEDEDAKIEANNIGSATSQPEQVIDQVIEVQNVDAANGMSQIQQQSQSQQQQQPQMVPPILLDNLPMQTEIEQIANRLPIQANDILSNAADLAMANDFIKHMQQVKNEMQNAVEHPPNDRVLQPHGDSDENEHSPYMRNVNKWTEQEMIQTRRSVSSSPSSVSDENDTILTIHNETDDLLRNVNEMDVSLRKRNTVEVAPPMDNHHQSAHQTHQQQPLMQQPLMQQPPMQQPPMQQQPPQLISQIQPFSTGLSGSNAGQPQYSSAPVSLFPPPPEQNRLVTCSNSLVSRSNLMSCDSVQPQHPPGAAMFPALATGSPPPHQSATWRMMSSPATLPPPLSPMEQPQPPPQLPMQPMLQPQLPMQPMLQPQQPMQQPQQPMQQPQQPMQQPMQQPQQQPQQQPMQQPMQQPQHPQLQQNNLVMPPMVASVSNMQPHVQYPNESLDKTPNTQPINHQMQATMATMHKENNNQFTASPFDQMQNATNPMSSPCALTINATKSPSPLQNSSSTTSKRSQRNNVTAAVTPISIKSPNKSPGKSPRQMEMVRQRSESARGRPRAARNSNASGRGRAATGGRARGGRGRTAHIVQMPNALLELNSFATTIHNKLQGTVYDLDFDEDFAENVENLKSMRDHRRRSIDCRQVRDASQSPKFPTINNQKRMMFTPSDIRDLRPPSPIRHDTGTVITTTPPSLTNATPPMHSMQPVMPGPVDMRTYNSTYDTTANNEVFNSSLLGVFASGIADQTLPDIDEEVEKDFQSALKASNTKPATVLVEPPLPSPLPVIVTHEPPQATVTIIEAPMPVSIAIDQAGQADGENVPEPPKHSLIKLKIKGPHARPENYTSSVITSYPTATLEQQCNTPNNSFRRMRKKELLRQYWTQENMDDSNCALAPEQMPNMALNTTNSGRSAGIPKAVDSMSSIPTKDDYKDYATIDTKKRKAGMSRELRHLDTYDDVPERRRSVGSNASNTSSSNAGGDNGKRKTRTKQAMMMTTPKLKIKIGSSIIEPTGAGDFGSLRPPKKRLANMDVTAMDFRKKTKGSSADDEKSKAKKKKKREEKRKKKKEKKHQVEIVSSECSTSKLIIRFAKKKAEDVNQTAATVDAIDESKSNSPLSTAPIRMKIARNSQGGGYGVVESRIDTNGGKALNSDAICGHAESNCQVVLTGVPKNIQNEVKLTEHDEKLLLLQQNQNTDANAVNNLSLLPLPTLASHTLPTGKLDFHTNSFNSNATPFDDTAALNNASSIPSEHLTIYLPTTHQNSTQLASHQNLPAQNEHDKSDANASVPNVGSLLALSKDCEVR